MAISPNIDRLVDYAVVNGMAETGTPAEWLVKQSRIHPQRISRIRVKHPPWSPEEILFVEKNLPYLLIDQVAARIGRSVNAIHVQMARDKRFHCMSKQPGWLTGHQAAKILGADIHSIIGMNQQGILKFETLPGPRHILRIRKISLYVWACDPMHWPYFKQEKVTDLHLKRLLDLKKARWNDEWWTIGKVAKYHGLAQSNMVNQFIHRHQPKYGFVDRGNWWILRSVAVGMKFFLGKGFAFREWSPRADAYILRARAQGMRYADIGARMKWHQKTVEYRYRVFLKGKKYDIH